MTFLSNVLEDDGTFLDAIVTAFAARTTKQTYIIRAMNNLFFLCENKILWPVVESFVSLAMSLITDLGTSSSLKIKCGNIFY